MTLRAATREAAGDAAEAGTAGRGGDAVALRQRVWPLVEMLRRCQAAREVIVWGT